MFDRQGGHSYALEGVEAPPLEATAVRGSSGKLRVAFCAGTPTKGLRASDVYVARLRGLSLEDEAHSDSFAPEERADAP